MIYTHVFNRGTVGVRSRRIPCSLQETESDAKDTPGEAEARNLIANRNQPKLLPQPPSPAENLCESIG